jgi:hypothetical protein
LADNGLGALVVPEGWQQTDDDEWIYLDGSIVNENPGKPEGIIALANAIPDMRALLVLSLKGNNLRADGGKALAEGLKSNEVVTELNIAGNYLGLDSRGGTDTSGVGALANVIPDMGALTSLNLASNNLGAPLLPAGWTHHPGNRASYRFQHTDGSHQEAVPEGTSYPGAIFIADAIKDARALTSLHVGSNGIPEKEMREIMAIAMRVDNIEILCQVPFKDKTITELDLSGENLGTEGALVVAEYLDGALTQLDISDNMLCGLYFDGSGTYNGAAVAALSDMLKVNSVLKELNMSKTYVGPEGAKVLSLGLSGNGTMTVLNLANNQLGKLVLPEGWSEKHGNAPAYGYIHTDGREHKGAPEGAKFEGSIALANAIPDMKALIKLDISNNYIGAEQKGGFQRICVASGINLAM